MKVVVTEANGSERIGALYSLIAWTEQFPDVVERPSTVLADAGYRGETFRHGVCSMVGAEVEILTHPTREFAIIAKRWVVERTFAGWNLYLRLRKDYELLPEVSEGRSMLSRSTSRCAVLPLLNFSF